MNTSAVRIEPDKPSEQVSDKVEEEVEQHPWLERLARFGWIAKGVVYALMGLTAFTIGRRRPTSDDASPEGAVGQLRATQFGTALIWLLAVGLVLYVAWRLLSAALIRGHEVKDWLNRIGYLFSAAFYAVLAITAVTAVMHGDEPTDRRTRWSACRDGCSATPSAGGRCSSPEWSWSRSASSSSSTRASSSRS